MADVDDRMAYEAYSRAEITRAELARRLGWDISFGELLLKLREQRLQLPRYPSDPNSLGVRLIHDLAARGRRAD